MKIRYFHSRVPDDVFENLKHVEQIPKGKPPLIILSAYNRKRGKFINPYEREYCKPASRGGMTECVIYDESGNRYEGTAYCSLSDNFNYKVGREIAFQRAYENFIRNEQY